MVQSHLLEYGQLNYDMFINDFIKTIVSRWGRVKVTIHVAKFKFFFCVFIARRLNFVIIFPTSLNLVYHF